MVIFEIKPRTSDPKASQTQLHHNAPMRNLQQHIGMSPEPYFNRAQWTRDTLYSSTDIEKMEAWIGVVCSSIRTLGLQLGHAWVLNTHSRTRVAHALNKWASNTNIMIHRPIGIYVQWVFITWISCFSDNINLLVPQKLWTVWRNTN